MTTRQHHRRPTNWLRSALAACAAAAALSACAVNRPTLDPAKLAQQRERYLETARADTRASNEKMLKRMSDEWSQRVAQGAIGSMSEPPTFDVLILSGGGDYGAFGAGFLKGWGMVEDVELKRPVFDMVTGVSTGALIAPFAFVGDDPAYGRIMELYTEPKADWFTLRGWLFFLPGNESFMDNAGLKRDLEKSIDEGMVHRMAAASRENRVLAVNTTNLDMQAMHPFEVSEAERAEASGDRSRLISILLASAAIPAAFPPVIIDGSLYVDGGATSNILYGANWLSPRAPLALWAKAHPGEPLPKLRFWVVVNNQLGVAPQIVQPTWMSITKSSMATAIRSSTIIALRHLYTQIQVMQKDGVDAEFRYVSIPADWVPPNQNDFDKDVMKSLADLGLRMGSDGAAWKRDFSAE